jgi:hypothetical protein
MAGAEAFAEHFGLCTLADTRSAEQNDAPGFVTRFSGRQLAFVFTALKPRSAVMMDKDADGVGLWKDSVNTHAVNISMRLGKTKQSGRFCQNRSGFCQDLQNGWQATVFQTASENITSASANSR